MFSKSQINNKSQIQSIKPCCKVCKDAGKSEKEFTSHFVKDIKGNVICPTLLNQECRFCHKKGHTTSHCATLKKQKDAEENSRKTPLSPVRKEAPVQKKSNVFAYLDMESDSDNEVEAEVEVFPELVKTMPKDAFEKEKNVPKKFSYASMAAKTVTEYKIEQLKETNITPYIDKKFEVQIIKKVWPALAPGQKKSWSQIEDEISDEEEEYEEVEDNSAW